jgi:hypothetical protein
MPIVTATPFTSRGHLPEQAVDVRANEVARSQYAALVTDSVFPDGSVIAELAHDRAGKSYVMRKSGGAWSYFELDALGSVLVGGGPALCVGCHDQAAADHLFGLPRSP